ncbi:Nucleoside permease NupC [compost metagenome]
MATIDNTFEMIVGLSFQHLLGYVFAPFTFIMGIPASEVVSPGGIYGTKLVTNEFVAMMNFSHVSSHFSVRTLVIIYVFLVSFSNFSSIGIIAGAVKGLSEKQGNVVTKFGLRWLYGATLVRIILTIIVSIILKNKEKEKT